MSRQVAVNLRGRIEKEGFEEYRLERVIKQGWRLVHVANHGEGATYVFEASDSNNTPDPW